MFQRDVQCLLRPGSTQNVQNIRISTWKGAFCLSAQAYDEDPHARCLSVYSNRLKYPSSNWHGFFSVCSKTNKSDSMFASFWLCSMYSKFNSRVFLLSSQNQDFTFNVWRILALLKRWKDSKFNSGFFLLSTRSLLRGAQCSRLSGPT